MVRADDAAAVWRASANGGVMATEVHVKGLAELQTYLDQLAPKIERNILRGALRAGMKVVQPVARANIHSVSGILAAGLKIGSRARGGRVLATLVSRGKHGPLAHLLEYGVKAHTITAKGKKALSFNGLLFQSVNHPGFAKKPFLRPALDQEATNAVVAAGEYIKQRLNSKYGLDTAHIMIEGDE